MKYKVYQGGQFVFVRPYEKEPVEVRITGERQGKKSLTHEIRSPRTFSRLFNRVVVGDFYDFQPVYSQEVLPGAIVTDKKIYKPGEKVNYFVFFPSLSGENVKIEIRKNGRVFFQEEVSIDESGSFKDNLPDVNQGQYEILVQPANRSPFSCSFDVAQYSLSFLRANLVSHRLDNDVLKFQLDIIAGDYPYTGDIKVGLFCGYCDVVVEEKEEKVQDGRVKGEFTLSGHTGPFHLNLITPQGDHAQIFLPGTRSDLRENIQLTSLGIIIEGGLQPASFTTDRYRGIYIGNTGAKTAPVTMESIVGERVKLDINQDFDHLLIVLFEPVIGSISTIEKEKIKRGTSLDINVPHPFAFLTVGGIGKDCFEGYAFVLRPENMELNISAPSKAKPGEEVEIIIKSQRKGKLLLIVADSRLEREDPLNKLTEIIYSNAKENLSRFRSGKVEEFVIHKPKSRSAPGGFMAQISDGFRMSLSAAMPMNLLGKKMEVDYEKDMDVDYSPEPMMALAEPMPMGDIMLEQDEQSILAPTPVKTTTRMDFPQLLFSDLLEFSDSFTKKIKLGDQIGAFNIYCFLFDGMDYISAKHSIETAQDLYVEMDLPAFMSEGDEIKGKVMAKSPLPADLKVLSPITSLTEKVQGFKSFEIPLKGGGEVMAEIESPKGKDITSKFIDVPGREKVTVSQLLWLSPGESAEGETVMVYPGIAYMMKDSVSALLQYPFGCAEQTSAKLYGLGLVYNAIKKGVLKNGSLNPEKMIYSGVERMNLFYRDGLFSLWEGGEPATYVTQQVLRNLVPFRDMDILNLKEMLSQSARRLVREKVRDNRLIPYAGEFRTEMKTISDASAFYLMGIEKEKAVRLIKEKAIIEGEQVRWEDPSCWCGFSESTCKALMVMESEDPVLFHKGLNYISSKLKNGMLYSTSDTCAFLELLGNIHRKPGTKGVIDGEEKNLETPLLCKKVEAIDELLVRVDRSIEIDHLKPCSNFEGELEIERTSLKLGEKIKLTVFPRKKTIAPLVRIYLPGNVASLTRGAGVQKLYLPIREDRLVLELYGIRKGTGKLRVVLHDMYEEESVGVLPSLVMKVE